MVQYLHSDFGFRAFGILSGLELSRDLSSIGSIVLANPHETRDMH